MKVLFRMLASILPGVVVGLGVIAYLEREALQEQWMLYSEGKGHDELHQPVQPAQQEAPAWNPPTTKARQIEVPETFSAKAFTAEPETASTPSEQVVEKPMEKQPQPVEAQRTDAEVVEPSVVEAPTAPKEQPESLQLQPDGPAPQQDLAVVVGLEPAPEDQKPETMVERPLEQELTAVKEPQREISEVVEEQLPVMQQQIANLSRPIENLARQFNPLNGTAAVDQLSSKGKQEDIWAVGEPVEESQLQWLWNRGRQAFWEGNYEQAVESYRSLLEEDEKNPDAWGELGNIYYAKKDWVRAVRAFGRAAAVLIEVDRVDEANKIIQIIRTIDPALADQLKADLKSS